MKGSLFIGFVLLVSTGCSRQAGSGEPANACSIISKQAAESVLGVSLKQTSAQAFGQNARQEVISNCLFVSPSDELKTFSFTVRKGGIAEEKAPADVQIDTMKEEFGERYVEKLKKLDGFGDGAIWDSSLNQLTVFKGGSTYVWAATGATVGDVETKLVTLARKTI